MKVSILVPVYNCAPYLPQCLGSILAQAGVDLQLVLVDDGSTDASGDICDRYAAKYPQVEAYHQPNQGVAAARNALLSHIQGDAFLFVDADDWLEPATLSTLARLMQERDADIVNFGMVVNDAQPQHALLPLQEWDQSTTVHQFLRHTDFNGSLWNKLTRVSLLQGSPTFRPGISYGEDALFTWQLLQHAKKVVRTQRECYHYRMHQASLSHQAYGPKKQSGHQVWQEICADVDRLWPQYRDVAQARFAAEDMWQLYFAIKSGYPKDDFIAQVQRHVRHSLPLLRRSGLVNQKKLIFAVLASHCYACGTLLGHFM